MRRSNKNNTMWQERRITLEATDPVPFWTALDRLCRDAKLQHNIPFQGTASGMRGTIVQLSAGLGFGAAFVFDSGPFRVSLQGIHHHRDLTLNQPLGMTAFFPGGLPPQPVPNPVAQPPAARPAGAVTPPVHDQFFLDLQVMAEPRMVLSVNGNPKITEAVDEKGQSLLIPAAGGPAQRNAGFFGYNGGNLMTQLRVDLKYPEQPGKVIKRMRGSIPVTVSARKDDPLLIPLAESKGRTFRNSDVSVQVQDIRPEPNLHGTAIDISIRPNAPAQDPSAVAGQFGPEMFAFRTQTMPQAQIEIFDAQGRAYQQWFPSPAPSENEEVRMTLKMLPNDNVGPPAQIRFYDLVRAVSEATFEFTDIPMP
jgi:hypothetical protein